MKGFVESRGIWVDADKSVTISRCGDKWVAAMVFGKLPRSCHAKGDTPEAAHSALLRTKVLVLPEVPAGKRVSPAKVSEAMQAAGMTGIAVWCAIGYAPGGNSNLYAVLGGRTPMLPVLARRLLRFFGDAVLEAAP